MKQIKLDKLYKNRVLQHTLFWLVSYYVLLHLFSSSSENQRIDFIYTSLFHISIIIGVYINLFFLIPKYLSRKKYLVYIIFLIVVIAASTEFNILFFDKIVDIVLPGYYFISYYEYIDILKFIVVYIAITSLIKLSKSWFRLLEINKRVIELQKEKTEMELKALKSQINPHFLFNSLNVLYSLSLKNAKETPESIIKLSDILRYVIYDSNKEKVSIKSEVELINNYLSLQEYRVDKTSIINFTVDIQKDMDIAPMLFLPLVENSFKHGVKGDVTNTFVNIKLKTTNKIVHFEIENNKGSSENPDQNKDGGIGLTNIKKRLSLLYPEKHELLIKDNKQKFKVSLKINL